MALTITLEKTPADLLTQKVVPVYNGLPFIISSNNVYRKNFKYIADVYVDDFQIARIKHNKDSSNENFGIFDFGRIIENYIKPLSNHYKSDGSLFNYYSITNQDYVKYNINFGAEYERYIDIVSMSFFATDRTRVNWSVTNSGNSDLRVGDYVFLTNMSNSSYNGPFKVSVVSGSYIIIDGCPFVGTATGQFIEGEVFSGIVPQFDTIQQRNFCGFFQRKSPLLPTRLKVGDTITTKQLCSSPIKPQYDGEWLITNIYTTYLYNFLCSVFVTNCPFVGTAGICGGAMASNNKVVLLNQVITSDEYAFGGALQYSENWNPLPYVMSGSTSNGKFLTNSPRTLKIKTEELSTLSVLGGVPMNSNNVTKVKYNFYGSTGLLNTISGTTTPNLRYEIGVGTENLKSLQDFTNVTYYTIELCDGGLTPFSETFRFNIDTKCSKYVPYRFKWLNRLGGWDFYTFNLRSDKTTTIERQSFRKFTKSLQLSNSKYDWNYKDGDRGNTIYGVNAVDSEVVFSDWIKEDVALWLEELYTSPEVYLIKDNKQLPIHITTSELVAGEKENIGLIQYSIDFTYSFNKNIQRNQGGYSPGKTSPSSYGKWGGGQILSWY